MSVYDHIFDVKYRLRSENCVALQRPKNSRLHYWDRNPVGCCAFQRRHLLDLDRDVTRV